MAFEPETEFRKSVKTMCVITRNWIIIGVICRCYFAHVWLGFKVFEKNLKVFLCTLFILICMPNLFNTLLILNHWQLTRAPGDGGPVILILGWNKDFSNNSKSLHVLIDDVVTDSLPPPCAHREPAGCGLASCLPWSLRQTPLLTSWTICLKNHRPAS